MNAVSEKTRKGSCSYKIKWNGGYKAILCDVQLLPDGSYMNIYRYPNDSRPCRVMQGESEKNMAKINRKANYEEKEEALEHDATFSMAEIEDVLELVATHQWPDVRFSDNECDLWSLIRRKLNINF